MLKAMKQSQNQKGLRVTVSMMIYMTCSCKECIILNFFLFLLKKKKGKKLRPQIKLELE